MAGTVRQIAEKLRLRAGHIESEKLAPPTEILEDAVRAAASAFSRYSPRRTTHEFSGEGKRRYVLSDLIDGWDDSFDRVLAAWVVTDPGTDDEVAEEIETWTARDTAGKTILFTRDPVPAGKTLRLSCARRHVVSDDDPSGTTIPGSQEEAFFLLGDWSVATWIARAASDLRDIDLGAEETDYTSIADAWASRAREALREAKALLGADDEPGLPAVSVEGASVTWEDRSPLARQPRVSH